MADYLIAYLILVAIDFVLALGLIVWFSRKRGVRVKYDAAIRDAILWALGPSLLTVLNVVSNAEMTKRRPGLLY